MSLKKGKIASRPSALSLSSQLKGAGGWQATISWRFFFLLVGFLVLISTALMLDQIFKGARRHSVQLVTAASAFPERISGEESTAGELSQNHGSLHLLWVRDIVSFPDGVMLLVSARGSGSSATLLGSPPSKDNLACLFGTQYAMPALSADWNDDRETVLAVRCDHPPAEALPRLSENSAATVLLKDSKTVLPSAAAYSSNSSWTPLVYQSFTVADSVLLFVKGLVDSHGRPVNFSRRLNSLHCQFGSDVTSPVRMVAQEVVRCELPDAAALARVAHARVSLLAAGRGLFPSVAYFDPPPAAYPKEGAAENGEKEAGRKRRFRLCSCTMLWNQAQFLREWITYHGFLGMERWFIYDNNSDDNIEAVLEELRREKNFNVTRHAWPWIKTQEAGFSHCALRARRDCEWVLFVDVDEFVFPIDGLHRLVYGRSPPTPGKGRKGARSSVVDFSPPEGSSPSAWRDAYETTLGGKGGNRSSSMLGRLIDQALEKGKRAGLKVGQVQLACHNFAPSGRTRAPEEGVMVGYTCRMQWPERHKSFLWLDAMSDSLMNVVHHFKLREGYRDVSVYTRVAVINHYKYQAWEVFKSKFVRRVATYVVDWKDQTAHSKDRAPGMGLRAVEPDDWPSRYCEEQDWGLRNFSWNFFKHPETGLLPWQIHPRVKLE